VSKEWGIPPWEQAGLSETRLHPAWRVWQMAYLWAQNERARHARAGVR
jgi:hypothetical protein